MAYHAAVGSTDNQDTKTKLILAAERLFATHGIEGVALRQITQAAGQRNESALQYHFGSRAALIEAIFERRMSVIDGRRNLLLDRLERENRTGDLRALVGALVYPLSEPIRDRTVKNYYNRFLAEVQRSPGLKITQFIGGKYDRGLQRAHACMQRPLGHLPLKLFRQRYVFMTASVVYGVADMEKVMAQRQDEGREFDLERAIENLVDMATGAMAAPVSETTMARLAVEAQPEHEEREKHGI